MEEILQVDTSDNNTFQSLGLSEELCKACQKLNWKNPSRVQREVIPVALEGHDIVAMAETGSGKTGAFALPIIHRLQQDLLVRPFALVLVPTRDLALQVAEQFQTFGEELKIKCVVIVGGENIASQCIELAKKPHIIVACPGRLAEIFEKTKGLVPRILKYLVLDEADKILDLGFEEDVKKILGILPKNRRTFLFSATLTQKVKKLRMIALKNSRTMEISVKFQVPATLIQRRIMVKDWTLKESYLVYLLNELAGSSVIIFAETCDKVHRLSLTLKKLGFSSTFIYGQLSQEERKKALERFKNREKSILVGTNLLSRGLDIPQVDCVVVYDPPVIPKEYFHMVGRTARAGREGKSFIFVTDLDLHQYVGVESVLGYEIPGYVIEEDKVVHLPNLVAEAEKSARDKINEPEKNEIKRKQENRKERTKERKRTKRAAKNGGEDKDGGDSADNDTEDTTVIRKKPKRRRY